MRIVACFLLIGCNSATWTDTFAGTDSRTDGLDEGGIVDDDSMVTTDEAGAPGPLCDGLAASKPTVPITVTFPGHGTPNETIHIVASSGTCDVPVDSDTDGVIFSADASPCASLIAAGDPSLGSATVFGTSSPTDLSFQWSYGVCTIIDDYSLSKE